MSYNDVISINTQKYEHPKESYIAHIKFSSNPKYTKAKDIDIETYLPESFLLRIGSDYDSKLKSYLTNIGQALEGVAGGLSRAIGSAVRLGYDLSTMSGKRLALERLLSFPTWEGNTPLDITIPFTFNATYNAEVQVVRPMRALMTLVCPILDDDQWTMTAPGPYINYGALTAGASNEQGILNKAKKVASNAYNSSVKDFVDPGRTADIYIGRFFRLKDALVTQVDCTYDSKFDINGYPMSGTANVQVRSLFAPTAQDIMQFLTHGSEYSQLDAFGSSSVKGAFNKVINTVSGMMPKKMNTPHYKLQEKLIK